MENIGKNIQYCRKFYNMTQRDLAKKINKTESSIKKYESGATKVPMQVLEDIAEVFNINVQYLLGDESTLQYHILIESFSDKKGLSGYEVNNRRKIYDTELIDEIYKNFAGLNYKFYDVNKSESFVAEATHEVYLDSSSLKESLSNLATYANKNEDPKLTDRQQDILFDSVIDYIKFKLYNFDKE